MAANSREHPDWIGLGEASELLGIAPGTLRRWADEGRVGVFTTPGGHRRFSRSALRSLLPAERTRRPDLARLGASAERISRAYRPRRSRARQSTDAWLSSLSEDDRAEFRTRGRALVALLVEHLDATDSQLRATRLQEAARLAAEYGRSAADRSISLSEAVEGFLRFRAPFVAELASVSRRKGLDTREATALLTDAEAAMDRLLVAMMTGHSLAAGPRRRAARP